MAIKDYAGDGITVHFDAEVCEHSGNCVRGLPSVFDAKRRPWIDPSGADADAIAAQIGRCPSGALTYTRTTPSP